MGYPFKFPAGVSVSSLRESHSLAAQLFSTILLLPGLLLFGARDGVYCGRIQRGALLESARDRVCILLGESHPVWRRWFVGLASLLLLLAPEREIGCWHGNFI